MNKIAIKKKFIKNENRHVYYVQALSLKNNVNKVSLLIPHPHGTDVIEFETLKEAAAAVKKSGFEYELPEGEFVSEAEVETAAKNKRTNLEGLLFNKFKEKINSVNPSIAAAAITSFAELNDSESIDIFIEKMGEENEKIRTAAINAIVSFKDSAIDKLTDALTNGNWVTRHSAITCLLKISEISDVDIQKIIIPIINRMDDSNAIVQALAISAAGSIYKNSVKSKVNN